MNNKATKRALVSSVMALFLCFAMLLGTTFAWFTDSVSSLNNVITVGNLDINLEYAKLDADGNLTDWAPVEANDEIFDPNALWEPGRVEVVYLRVSNLGTLALKYQLSLNITGETEGTNVFGEKFKLSDYLVFKTVEMPDTLTTYTDREAATLASGNAMGMKDYVSEITPLEVKDTNNDGVNYAALIVYMPETVGNVANYKTGTDVPNITFGINVHATQFTYEDDSFDNEYDDGARIDAAVSNADEFNAALDAATGDKYTIFLNQDINGDLEAVQKKDTTVVIDGGGKTINGALLINGRSAQEDSAGIVIRNVVFKADSIDEDACINLGNGANATRYTCNVTIENCTFDVPGAVGVKSYTGGDKNLTISNCTVSDRCHSLAQLANVGTLVVDGCTVNAARGINVNQTENVTVKNSTFNVKKYAIRYGADSADTGFAETYVIENCTIASANESGDAAIILRGTAGSATLTIVGSTITAGKTIANNTSATVNQ